MIRAVVFLLLTVCLALPVAAQEFRALARIIPAESHLRDAGRNGAELVLSISQAVPFRVFTLDDPMRVVVDFREVGWDGLDPAFDQASGIARVQTGGAREAGWSRMVMDLARSMAVDQAAMITDPHTGAARITITLRPVSQDDFSRLARSAPDTSGPVAVAPSPSPDDGRLIVVIDPGHGGVDPGAVRGDHTEAELVLTFARELRDLLRRTGRIEVILTRDSDIFVPLPTRLSIARAAGADAFMSIHADAIAEGRAQGATVYTLSDTASDAASAALAEQHDRADLLAGVDLHGADDVVAGVLMDLARVETAPRSSDLADAVVAAMSDHGLRLHSRPRMEAGFTVLKAADIPSVLVEVGFMSDDADLANLLDPDWRGGMQAALRDAILGWADADVARQVLVRQ